MNRKHRNLFSNFILSFLIICILSTAGCGAQKAGTPVVIAPEPASEGNSAPAPAAAGEAGAEPEAASNGTAETAAEGESQASFADAPIELAEWELPSLGSIAYTVDAAHQVEGEFTPNSSDLILGLTDGAGLTWTLTIPAQALSKPQTIRMTALAALQSSDIPGNLVGGVLLEPDGLEFDVPATLTVTGAPLVYKTLILSGSADGSQMTFTEPQETTVGASSLIWHFSLTTADDADDAALEKLHQRAVQQYQEVSKQALEVIKDSAIQVPRPPSSPLNCPTQAEGETNAQQLNQFLQEFENPENALMRNLLNVQRQLELLGTESDFSLVHGLLDRMVKKADLLIDQYGQNLEYLPAILGAVFNVAYQVQLLGADATGNSTRLLERIAAMYEKAIDKLFDKLVKEHEYWTIQAIYDAARIAMLLKGETSLTAEQIFERMQKALHFDLELTYRQTEVGNLHWVVQAKFPLEFNSQSAYINEMNGSGTGSMLSFVADEDPEMVGVAPDFAVNASIKDFQACEGTATLILGETFAPPNETYDWLDDDVGPLDSTLISAGWQVIFENYKGDAGYEFPLTIRNNDAVAIETTLENNLRGNVEGYLDVKLVHTPK